MSEADYKRKAQKGKSRLPVGFLIALAVGVGLGYIFVSSYSGVQEITWQRFKNNMLLKHDVARIAVLNKERVDVYIIPDSCEKAEYNDLGKSRKSLKQNIPQYYFTIGSVESFEKRMDDIQLHFSEAQQVPISYVNNKGNWAGVVSWILPALSILLLWFFFAGRGRMDGSAAIDFSKSKAEEYGETKLSPFGFKDVAGYEEAKAEVMEVVSFLKEPQNFTRLGAKIPKGVLLIGPPGTGKTLMAKAVAGEAAVPFFSLSGSEFVELFVGVGASRVRDLFNRAKAKAPSIIFIDEIDTIGRVRGKAVSLQVNDERESTLNQLLTEMDGFDPNTGVIVMAATNRADLLDAALLRAGRFDRHIYLELPNKQERIDIFNVHLKNLLLDKEVDSVFLASQTPGFSGADIANVCNEAALIAARRKATVIQNQDFSEAIDRITAGLEKKTKVITPAERKVIAYHEAGHALVSWMLKNIDPLIKVSIIPRGKSLGSAWYLPEEKQIITKSQFTDQLCATLGGRAAEELACGEISSGALDDLEKATKQAYSMVMNLGLSDQLGNISYYDSTGVYENTFQKPYSEATARLIDSEVRKLIQNAYDQAKSVIAEHKNDLERLALLLLSREVVYRNEIEDILGQRTEQTSDSKSQAGIAAEANANHGLH